MGRKPEEGRAGPEERGASEGLGGAARRNKRAPDARALGGPVAGGGAPVLFSFLLFGFYFIFLDYGALYIKKVCIIFLSRTTDAAFVYVKIQAKKNSQTGI